MPLFVAVLAGLLLLFVLPAAPSSAQVRSEGWSTAQRLDLTSQKRRLKSRKLTRKAVKQARGWPNKRSLVAMVDGKPVHEGVTRTSYLASRKGTVLATPGRRPQKIGELLRGDSFFSSPGFLDESPLPTTTTGTTTGSQGQPRQYSIRRLAIELVYQYGGPESAYVDCAGWIEFLGVKTCRPGIKFMQHGLWVSMYGPDDVDPGQLVSIKDSCLASAIAVHAVPLLLATDVLGALFSELPAMEGTFRTCITTTEVLSKIVVPDFRLQIQKSEWW